VDVVGAVASLSAVSTEWFAKAAWGAEVAASCAFAGHAGVPTFVQGLDAWFDFAANIIAHMLQV
jgi:hypothetical protein